MTRLSKPNDAEILPESRNFQTLSDLPAGEQALVRALRGGKEFTSRMATLGFTVGVELTVVQNYGRGPVIVLVRDTRVALGRGEALKVLVEVAQGCET